MTEWNDLDPDDDGAQFFRRGGGGPGAPCPSPELVQAARMGTLRHTPKTVLPLTSNAVSSVRRSATR